MPYKFHTSRRHPIPTAKYRVTNWPDHDRGLVRRGDIRFWIDEGALVHWNAPKRRGLSPRVRGTILKPLETIECRDAILAADGSEPDWPEAEVVIGNPPFLGDRVMRGGLGHEYTERLRRTYRGSVASSADLVCYWFHKAGRLVANGKLARAGLVATNSIRGGNNRAVLDRIVEDSVILDAWSDEPWVIDGAAVRVSLVCFAPNSASLPVFLNSKETTNIHADLTEGSIDLTRAARLATNQSKAFLGVNKNGAFDIPGAIAREWLRLPANPNGRPNADVLKPRMVGMDVVQRSSDQWIIDFGTSMTEAEAALYEAPFAHVAEHIKPVRATNRIKALREQWWRHWWPRPAMWRALEGMALHRDADPCEEPPVRLARRARVPRPSTHRCRPRRRHGLRHLAQPVSRGMVVGAGN